MDRRRFIGTLTGTLLAEPLAAQAQPSGGGAHVGLLSVDAGSFDDAGRNAFGAALRELGWIVGANLVVEARYAAGQPDRLSALAAELVRLKVELDHHNLQRGDPGGPAGPRSVPRTTCVEPCPRIGDYVTATGRLCRGDVPPGLRHCRQAALMLTIASP